MTPELVTNTNLTYPTCGFVEALDIPTITDWPFIRVPGVVPDCGRDQAIAVSFAHTLNIIALVNNLKP